MASHFKNNHKRGKRDKIPNEGPPMHALISEGLMVVIQISYTQLHLVYRKSRKKSERGNLEEWMQNPKFQTNIEMMIGPQKCAVTLIGFIFS